MCTKTWSIELGILTHTKWEIIYEINTPYEIPNGAQFTSKKFPLNHNFDILLSNDNNLIEVENQFP